MLQTAAGKTGLLTGEAVWQRDAYGTIRRRMRRTGVKTRIGNLNFPATGITACLKNKGALEATQQVADRGSPRTAKLYDHRQDDVSTR